MRIVPISEAHTTTDGNVIEALHGRVTQVHKRFSGSNDKGPWSLQKVTLQDSTGQIKVMFSGIGDIPQTWVGQDVYIQAGQSNGKQGGLCGLTAATDAKSNPPEKIVKASDKAILQFGQAPAAQPTAPAFQPPPAPPVQQTFTPPPPPATMAPPQAPYVPPPQPAPAQAPATNGKDVRHHLNQSANLYLHCILAGQYVRGEFNARQKDAADLMTDDQFQACVSALFIQADRSGLVTYVPGGKFNG